MIASSVMAHVVLNSDSINDWESFHDQCVIAFGFPASYGRNMNAWVDCLTNLHEGDGMSRFVLTGHEQLFVHVPDFKSFANRVPDICLAFLECTAFVNQRSLAEGDQPRLVLILE